LAPRSVVYSAGRRYCAWLFQAATIFQRHYLSCRRRFLLRGNRKDAIKSAVYSESGDRMITGNINQFLDTVNYIARLLQYGANEKATAYSFALIERLKMAVGTGEITQDDANLVLNFLAITDRGLEAT
jgi:hypothetical protein